MKWFVPIKNEAPALQKEYQRLKLNKKPITKAQSEALAAIRTQWRWERDSNSRWRYRHAGFQDLCIQPLCHPTFLIGIQDQSDQPPRHVFQFSISFGGSEENRTPAWRFCRPPRYHFATEPIANPIQFVFLNLLSPYAFLIVFPSLLHHIYYDMPHNTQVSMDRLTLSILLSCCYAL